MNTPNILAATLLACSCFSTTVAQNDYDPQTDFFAYKAKKLAYFDSVRTAKNGNMKGTGYTQFMRWAQHWQTLAVNDGSVASSLGARYNGLQSPGYSTGNKVSATVSGQWTEIGPVDPPDVPQTSWGTRIQGAGRLHFIEFDDVNGRVFCGSPASGLFYSEDNGQSWQNGGMDQLQEIGASHVQVAKNTNNGETWFVSTGDGDGAWNPSNGIWRTTDKGASWENIGQNNALGIGAFPAVYWARCRKILIHPANENILFAAFRHGVYKTTNALATNPANVNWTRVLVPDATNGGEFFDIQFKPGTNGSVIVVSGKKVNISYNTGTTWSLLADYPDIGKTPAQEEHLISIRFAQTDPDIFYGAYERHIFKCDLSVSSVVSHSDIGYDGWNAKYSRHQALGVSPSDENEVLIGNVNHIWKSTDGGQSFPFGQRLIQGYHDDLHWIEYHNTASEVWIATDGGVYRTTDGGQNWTNLSHGMGLGVFFHLSTCESLPYDIIGSGWDTGPNLHDPQSGNFKWVAVLDPQYEDYVVGDAFESVINGNDPNDPIYYVTASNHNFAKVKQGSIVDLNVGSTVGQRNWYQHLVKAGNQEEVLFYAGNKKIGRSVNEGSSWEAISPAAQDGGHADRLFYRVWNNPSAQDVLYTQRVNFAWQNGPDPDAFVLYRSENAMDNAAQVSWTDITPSLSGYNGGQPIRKTIHTVAVDEENPKKIWATFGGYAAGEPKVLKYDGSTWSDITGSGLAGHNVSVICHQEGTDGLLYVGTNAGVYYKKEHETQWTQIPGLPNCMVNDMEINLCMSKIRVSTFGRGIWEADLIEPTLSTSEVDLYMKDTDEDIGQTPSPGVYTDNGPDIWYRNNDDGLENRYSENLVFDGSPFWVYVRVRNKSCKPFNTGGNLSLHWSRLGSAFSWPSEWDGSTGNGNLVSTLAIPPIPAGGSAVIGFEWDMSNYIQSFPTGNVSACLLARIENVSGDPISAYPTLYNSVKNNNNLTMKNVVIREARFFKAENRVPVFVGGTEVGGVYDIHFTLPADYEGSSLFDEAEVTVQLDEQIWDRWLTGGTQSHNVEILDEQNRILMIGSDDASLQALTYEAGERDMIGVAVNFLVDEVTEQNEFLYDVSQTVHASETMIGAVHFHIWKEYREGFEAFAGADQEIYSSESVTLSAAQINEPAEYNWYDSNGRLIYKGTDTIIHPTLTEKYKLEVISLLDGFKDYDELEITVKDPERLEISPNPANRKVSISYKTRQALSAYVMLVNVAHNISSNYILDISKDQISIDIANYQSGIYKVILVCDGKVVDEASLSVQ